MNKFGGLTAPNFKTYNKAIVVKRIWHQCQSQEIDQDRYFRTRAPHKWLIGF